jgi:hypothetical protein
LDNACNLVVLEEDIFQVASQAHWNIQRPIDLIILQEPAESREVTHQAEAHETTGLVVKIQIKQLQQEFQHSHALERGVAQEILRHGPNQVSALQVSVITQKTPEPKVKA